jgi:hypothetical protein
MDQTQEHNGGWHLDKRISIGHIFTTLSVAFALMVWMNNLENRVRVSEIKIIAVEKAYEKDAADQSVQYIEIIRRLERLDQKIDSTIQEGR